MCGPASCAAAGAAEQPKADSKAQGKAKKAEAEKQAANDEEGKRRQVRPDSDGVIDGGRMSSV